MKLNLGSASPWRRRKEVGWNLTVRAPGRTGGYPVDENESLLTEEEDASGGFQGLEEIPLDFASNRFPHYGSMFH